MFNFLWEMKSRTYKNMGNLISSTNHTYLSLERKNFKTQSMEYSRVSNSTWIYNKKQRYIIEMRQLMARALVSTVMNFRVVP